jgi:hypothetical protein
MENGGWKMENGERPTVKGECQMRGSVIRHSPFVIFY